MAEEGATEVGFCNMPFRIPSLIRWQPLPPSTSNAFYGESNYYVYNKWLFILDLGLENMNSIEWIIRYTLRQKSRGSSPAFLT